MRIEGHRNTTLSGDTRVDWSDAYALVPSLQVGYVWHAGVYAGPVAAGLLRIGFEIASQVIWDKGLFAMSRGWYHWGHEPCWVVRRPGMPNLFLDDHHTQSTVWRAPSPKMIMGGSTEAKFDHPAQKPIVLFDIPIRNHLDAGEAVYDPFLGSGTTLIAAELLGRRCLGMDSSLRPSASEADTLSTELQARERASYRPAATRRPEVEGHNSPRPAKGGAATGPLSAKRAVDGDLIQSARKSGELLIVESGHEIRRDPASVNRHGLLQPGDARIGERNDDAAPVGVRVDSTNETGIDQPGDSARHARPGKGHQGERSVATSGPATALMSTTSALRLAKTTKTTPSAGRHPARDV